VNRQQLQAILWLRWRLTRNQFTRAGKVNAVLSVVATAGMLVGAVGAGVGGVVGGVVAGSKAPPEALLLIWDAVVFAFLVFWLTGLMVEIQRSESIDLPKLLHLPVTLPQVFGFNYVASHFTPGIVLMLPGMLGFCAGLMFGAGLVMGWLVPLVLSFVFMVTAWTYCVRGWLAALMVNKRRRRAIIVWVTIAFVALCQLPNLLLHAPFFRQQVRAGHFERRKPGRLGEGTVGEQGGQALPEFVLRAHLALPPGWIGYGAMTLQQHNVWPVLGATVANCLLGALGLMRAYRMTIRFYQGADGRAEQKPVPLRAPGRRGLLLVERRLPGLPDDTAALALATFRSLSRAPELKMAFIMPLMMGAMLASLRFTRSQQSWSGFPELWADFAAAGVAVFAAFSFAHLMANLFGLDRSGFRALVLLPTRRHHILLAKNLAFLPFAAPVALVMLAGVKFLVGLSWATLLAGVMQAGVALLLLSLAGNVLSILAPYRLATGTLQAKKPKAIAILAGFVTLLVLPLIMLPLLFPPALQLLFSFFNWAPWLPVNLVATFGLLAAAGWLYRLLLPLEGRLLERREQMILREVTEELE
jgi:hypothetical protein